MTEAWQPPLVRTLDLSLTNDRVYRGLAIESLAGKLTLVTEPDQAIGVITANLAQIAIDPEEVVITGSMAVWAYLVVFHYLHGRTKRIYYQDGIGRLILVAAHG